MSLDHAILGFLQYRPLSGYDLKAAFDVSVRHFWPADQSQIYRTLSRLAEQGLAKVEVIQQDERPDRKVYHITPAGRDELRRWLTTPLDCSRERVPILVQIFFAGHLSDDEALTMLRRMADQCRGILDVLRAISCHAEEPGHDLPARDDYFFTLTLDFGLRMNAAQLAWLEEKIAQLEAGKPWEDDGDVSE